MSEAELSELKGVLRALVVSSPTAMDARTLLRDYRSMEGRVLPYMRFGCTDPIRFLRTKCTDCFLFQGPESNPLLTLIVPKQLQHIDKFVQSQRMPTSNRKFKIKRRSVQESPHIAAPRQQSTAPREQHSAPREQYTAPRQQYTALRQQSPAPREQHTAPRQQSPAPREQYTAPRQQSPAPREQSAAPPSLLTMKLSRPMPPSNPYKWVNPRLNRAKETVSNGMSTQPPEPDPVEQVTTRLSAMHAGPEGSERSESNLAAFMRRRLPAALHDDDQDSARYSQLSGGSRCALETLRDEVAALVDACGSAGLRCEDVPAMYRSRHARELDVTRYGYPGIGAFVLSLCRHRPHLTTRSDPDGELVLLPCAADKDPPAPSPLPTKRRVRPPLPAAACVEDADDALPGIDFDPEVFPPDCMHQKDVIPVLGVQWALESRTVEVRIGEVYSPSHFWLQLLGEKYHIAMEEMMDDMTVYYSTGEGKNRMMSAGAIRRQQYCAALYDGDWHRAVILTEPTGTPQRLKVRHVDYGTVDSVPPEKLRPLLSKWASLPAQGVRARLAGVRPPAGARRWARAAAHAFLREVTDKHYQAFVRDVDTQANIVEVLLVDTSTAEDVRLDELLVRAGHAEACDTTMSAGGAHLLPTFDALEQALTPNFAEIHAYLRDGIALDCVPEYRQHVPSLLPPAHHAPPPPAHHAPPPAHAVSDAEYSASVCSDSLPSLSPSPPASDPSPSPGVDFVTDFVNRIPLLPLRDLPSETGSEGAMSMYDAVPAAMGLPVSMWSPPRAAPVSPMPLPGGGEVRLSVAECEVYCLLQHVDPHAAHCYMREAIRRAVLPSPMPPGYCPQWM